ncbi:hypothetical protein K470DRAFT_198455, partial [Piedraia hortae CBS 480.64]
MNLYILGPAFGLPSIDAECNAAVALLHLLPHNKPWHLIPAHEDVEPLPRLEDNNQTYTGLASITRHLSFNPLDPQTRTTTASLRSFITSHAPPLIDLYLYTPLENYSLTRTAYTKILPWYANYIIPPQRRALAKTRTQHLGIDPDEPVTKTPILEGRDREEAFEKETKSRASLLFPAKRVGMLRKEVFKLHALAEGFLEPLEEILRKGDYLVGDTPMEVDCLAYGYLSLMRVEVGDCWLRDLIAEKFKRVEGFVQRM